MVASLEDCNCQRVCLLNNFLSTIFLSESYPPWNSRSCKKRKNAGIDEDSFFVCLVLGHPKHAAWQGKREDPGGQLFNDLNWLMEVWCSWLLKLCRLKSLKPCRMHSAGHEQQLLSVADMLGRKSQRPQRSANRGFLIVFTVSSVFWSKVLVLIRLPCEIESSEHLLVQGGAETGNFPSSTGRRTPPGIGVG